MVRRRKTRRGTEDGDVGDSTRVVVGAMAALLLCAVAVAVVVTGGRSERPSPGPVWSEPAPPTPELFVENERRRQLGISLLSQSEFDRQRADEKRAAEKVSQDEARRRQLEQDLDVLKHERESGIDRR